MNSADIPLSLRRRLASIYIRSEAVLSAVAAAVTLASLLLSLGHWSNPALTPFFEQLGIVSGVLTLILVFARMTGSVRRMLLGPEGRVGLEALSQNSEERQRSLLEKIESGADFAASGHRGFSFELVRDPAALAYFVTWSEADSSIADSQSEGLDRHRLYRDWFDARPDAFMLARNEAGVPFCGSIVLPLKQKGADLLARDGVCAVTLQAPEIAGGAGFRHLLVDTWVGDLRLQSHRPRKHPPFDVLTQAGYALRVLHLSHFLRLSAVKYLWLEPSNPYLVDVVGNFPFAQRQGHTGKPKSFSYVISLDAARAFARAFADSQGSDLSKRVERLFSRLQAGFPESPPRNTP